MKIIKKSFDLENHLKQVERKKHKLINHIAQISIKERKCIVILIGERSILTKFFTSLKTRPEFELENVIELRIN